LIRILAPPLPDDMKNLVEAVQKEGRNWIVIFAKRDTCKLKSWMTIATKTTTTMMLLLRLELVGPIFFY
jgi:uncharacterized protein (DUF1810 family)